MVHLSMTLASGSCLPRPLIIVTRAMISDFNSLQVGLIFDASQITTGLNETSEQDPFGTGFNTRSVQELIGYT
jgi:hypothetical protein